MSESTFLRIEDSIMNYYAGTTDTTWDYPDKVKSESGLLIIRGPKSECIASSTHFYLNENAAKLRNLNPA